MISEETVRKLREMKLGGMADAYILQDNQLDYGDLTFEERFNLLVD